MKEITEFINQFIDAQFEASKAQLLPNLKVFNTKLKKMDSFLSDELKNRLGMTYLDELFSDKFYEEAHEIEVFKRHFFLIEKYENNKNEDFFLAYLSNTDDYKAFYECFVVKNKINKFEIISSYLWYYDNKKGKTKNWTYNMGENILIEKIGIPTDRLKILAPSDDKDSLKIYNALEA